MEVRHHIVGAPFPQHIYLIVVHIPEKEGNREAREHGVSSDIFRAKTQVRYGVTGGKIDECYDLCDVDPKPLDAVLNSI